MRDRAGREHGASQRYFQKQITPGDPAMEVLTAGTAIMLDCILRERGRLALPYAYLTLIRWDPGQQLWLEYPELVLHITGEHLGPLYAGLTTHRVFRIREAASSVSPLAVSIARITASKRQ